MPMCSWNLPIWACLIHSVGNRLLTSPSWASHLLLKDIHPFLMYFGRTGSSQLGFSPWFVPGTREIGSRIGIGYNREEVRKAGHRSLSRWFLITGTTSGAWAHLPSLKVQGNLSSFWEKLVAGSWLSVLCPALNQMSHLEVFTCTKLTYWLYCLEKLLLGSTHYTRSRWMLLCNNSYLSCMLHACPLYWKSSLQCLQWPKPWNHPSFLSSLVHCCTNCLGSQTFQRICGVRRIWGEIE